MKKDILFSFILLLFIASCSVSYNDDIIDPDLPYGTARDINPVFGATGFQDITVISIYPEYEYSMTFSRTYGVSREAVITLNISQEELDTYNQLYETSYKLLPADYYQIPAQTTFAKLEKNADFKVKFYPEKLVKAVGFNAASDYVLPVKAVADDEGIDLQESLTVVLLHVKTDKPTVAVTVPREAYDLNFIYESGFSESVVLETGINFRNFDRTQTSVTSAQADVDAYNQANGTSYLPLPDANFKFDDYTVDETSGLVSFLGKIDANNLDPEKEYLLAARVQSPLYTIEQSAPVFFIISIVDLKIIITDGGKVIADGTNVTKNTFNGKINVTMNSFIGDDVTIKFAYAPDLVDTYNAANGTSFNKFDASKVTVPTAKMLGGTKSVDVNYTIDISGLSLEEHYLVPLRLSSDDLEIGYISGPDVIYVDFCKNALGTYVLTEINNSRVTSGSAWSRHPGNEVVRPSAVPRADAAWEAKKALAQYAIAADNSWLGYAMLFRVTNEDMPGHANCKRIEIYTFLEEPIDGSGGNTLDDNQSYFNMITGELYFDFHFIEGWCGANDRDIFSLKLP